MAFIDNAINHFLPDAPQFVTDTAYRLAAGISTQGNVPQYAKNGMIIQMLQSGQDNIIKSGLSIFAQDYGNYAASGDSGRAQYALQELQGLISIAPQYGIDTTEASNNVNNIINKTEQGYAQNVATYGNQAELGNQLKQIAGPVLAAAAPFTGGASLAVGEAIMGTGAAGAATVGAALLGSATSATLAAVTGGDVTKSAIAGAISGGTAANASDIANVLTNNSVADIAASTGLTAAQVSNTITNAVTTGVVTAAVTGGNVATAVASSLAASGVSAEVQNTINNNLPDMSGTAKVIGNVAGVATRAAVSGTDVGTAIQNSVGQIIGGQLQDTTRTDTANAAVTTSQTDTGNTAVVVTTDPANNTALVMSTDGNVSVVATTENIASGSTVKIDPTTNTATVTNVATTGTTFAPTANAATVISDVGSSTDLVKSDGKVIISGDTFVYDPATDPRTEEQKLADYNKAIADGNTPEAAARLTHYTPPATTEILPTIVQRDTTGTGNTTRQVIDLINPSTNAANVVISTGTNTGNVSGTTLANATTGTANGSVYGTGNANVGIISTQDNAGNVAAINQTGNVTISTGGGNLSNANVAITDNVSSNISNNAATTTKTTPSGNALTSALSPSIIPSKSVAQAGIAGPSTAYLGQALGTTSPDTALSGGGTPVFSGEEGKKRNVWNIESLRNALGI